DDRRTGQPNPCRDETDAAASREFARQEFGRARDLCLDRLGAASTAANILDGVIERLAEPNAVPANRSKLSLVSAAAGSSALLGAAACAQSSSDSKSDGDGCGACCAILVCLGVAKACHTKCVGETLVNTPNGPIRNRGLCDDVCCN